MTTVQYIITVNFFPGQRVDTVNYRTRGRIWEPGTIIGVKAVMNGNEQFDVIYSVLLDRKVLHPTIGNPSGRLIMHNVHNFIKPLP